MNDFRALLLTKDDGGQSANWVQLNADDLMEGDVVIRVTHTTINYKDGLAVTGKAPIARRYPLVPGIDLAGRVEQSEHADFSPGDEVVITGREIGESHYGGYAQYARVSGDWIVPKPDNMTLAQCMAVGTAGFTAMLSVMTLEEQRVTPDKGPILVTGAAGGVGSVSVALLSKLGYEVHASTGRLEESDYLRGLGAREIVDRDSLNERGKPLGPEIWAGAIDSVGSHTLANVIAQTKFDGAVAACGLAQGADLKMTVMPFILRNVTLAGVNSGPIPMSRRLEAWRRLGEDLDLQKLDAMTQTRKLDDIFELADTITNGQIRGRMVLEVD